MVLLGGDMDFKIVDLETEFTLVLVDVNGLGGGGGLRELMNLNRSFPVMSILKIILAAFEFFRHMLDFRSCLGLA